MVLIAHLRQATILLFYTAQSALHKMKVLATTRFDPNGRPIAKWRQAMLRDGDGITGEFSLRSEFVVVFRDHMAVGRLRGPAGDEDLLPPLFRAEILHMADGIIRVAGLARDPCAERYTAQTWHLQELA